MGHSAAHKQVSRETRPDGTVIPKVSGTAHRTGEHRFTLDPLGTGFTLR